MSHYLPPQADCASAWLEAARFVNGQPSHKAHNVMFDVDDPTLGVSINNPIIYMVEDFLNSFDKSLFSIANTIFPNGLYHRHGRPRFIKEFHEKILPRTRRTSRWSGYYFERMTAYRTTKNQHIDQLKDTVDRISDPKNRSLNKFDISIFDPERDIDKSPYGGQCLSFLSFKLSAGVKKKLMLTAVYRNHYYIEKLLGNLIGLGWLMTYVANESGVGIGTLTVLSTHAEIDRPSRIRQDRINELLI